MHIPWNNDKAKAYLTYQRNRPLFHQVLETVLN